MGRVLSAALANAVPAAVLAEDRGLVDPAASGVGRWAWAWWAAVVVLVATLIVLVSRTQPPSRRGAPR